LHFTRTLLELRRDVITDQNEQCEWVATPTGVLAFDRGNLRCVVNFSTASFELPASATVLAVSGDLVDGALPVNTGVWLLLS